MKKIPFVPILVLGFLILATSLLYLKFGEERELSDIVRGINQDFSVSGQTHTLKAGRIEGDVTPETKLKLARLAAFYQWNREDPLFWSPDLDADKLETSIKNLNREHEKLLLAMEEETNLYPIEFLTQWPQTASTTKEFFENPSDTQAEKLLDSQYELARLYGKEANDLDNAISDDEAKIVGLNIMFTSKTIKGDLKKIGENAKALKDEIEKREKCLTGKGKCIRPSMDKKGETTPAAVEALDLLNPEAIYQHYNIRKEYQNITRTEGPYIAQTPCFGWGEDFNVPNHYFYTREMSFQKDSVSLNLLDIKLATDIYFYKLNPDSSTFADRKKAKQGIKYEHLGSTNLYLCPDNEYLAQIGEMGLFLKNKKPILQDLKNVGTQAKEAEKRFYEAPYPSWESLSRLGDYYALLYQNLANQPATDQSLKEELLTRYLSINRKLGSFNLLVNWITKFLPQIASDWEDNKEQKLLPIETKRKDIYRLKNFHGLVFLPFSPAFWRLETPPDYVEKTLVKNAIGQGLSYLNYKEAIKNYKKEEIDTWIAE